VSATVNRDGRAELFGLIVDDVEHDDETQPHLGPWSGWSPP
jgi:hypothetical protein